MYTAYVLLTNGQVISSTLRTTDSKEAYEEAERIARKFSFNKVEEYGSMLIKEG